MYPFSLVKKFLKDRSGNLSLVTAFVLPMLVMLGGFAVDFNAGMTAKRELQAAADAASLAVSTAYTNGEINQTNLEAIAQRYFKANAEKSGVDVSTLQFTVGVSGTAPKIVTMDVKAKYPVMLGGIYGRTLIDVAAKTTSTIGAKTYYQVGFLLDVSGSMAIGATTTDIAKLVTAVGCQFACHDPYNYNGGDKAAVAKAKGIKLKFDYVQSALNIFVDKLRPAALENPNYYKMGIFTFGTTFQTYQPLTTNMNDFDASAASVYLEPMINFSCLTHNGFTNVSNAFTSIKPELTNVGDGTEASKRKTYVVIITDGVQDTISSCGRQYSAAYSAACNSLKAAGINVITVQTGYPQMNDGTYNGYVKPLLPTIETTLRACASNGDSYIHADDGPAIEAAIRKAFATIFGDIRINS